MPMTIVDVPGGHLFAIDEGSGPPIVLLHAGKASSEPDSVVSPNRGNTVAALPAIIYWYTAHGFRFVAF